MSKMTVRIQSPAFIEREMWGSMKMNLRGTKKELRIRKMVTGGKKRVNESSMLSNQAENGGTDLCTLSLSHTIALNEERPCFIRSQATFYFLISEPFVLTFSSVP